MSVIWVFEDENIKICIYGFNHGKPHIHIVKKGVDMLLDGTLPYGSQGLSSSEIDMAREWLANHVEMVDSLIIDDVYIVDAIPLPHHHLLCQYNNGRWNLVDFRPLLQFPAFNDLKSERLFYDIDFSNGVTNWDNERIDIAPEYLYRNGISLSPEKVEFLKFVKKLNSEDNADVLGAIIEKFMTCVV